MRLRSLCPERLDRERPEDGRKGAGSPEQPPPERADIQAAVGSLPADRCGPPEGTASQAEIPQETGEGKNEAHTTAEVSIYENQGELRLGTARALSPAFSDLAP